MNRIELGRMAEHDAQLRSMHPRKRNETLRLIVTTFLSIALGFFIGIFFIRVNEEDSNQPLLPVCISLLSFSEVAES